MPLKTSHCTRISTNTNNNQKLRIWKPYDYVNCRLSNKYESNLCSATPISLRSSENKALKNFEPMTSAILVQYSTKWANKPTGSWSLCWFLINPISDEYMIVNKWNHICEKPIEKKKWKWSSQQWRLLKQ